MKGTSWEKHFAPFREGIVGQEASFEGPFGTKQILYADWIASGRLYAPIEEKLLYDFGPMVANTHTETSYTGALMTEAYHLAKRIIKVHVNAGPDDVFIPAGTGMTGAVAKFQRLLGIKVPEQCKREAAAAMPEKPVIFISHMEHHSNQTSWLETLAEVVQINPTAEGLLDLEHLAELLEKYKDRKQKIASITSASNVTGVFTPYHEVAKMMHAAEGLCFVDFACSGPYVDIDMHPEEEGAHLDAIFFSPHKFLGGPGTPGVLIFDKKLYQNEVPDQPGGGTVVWTNPWGKHVYLSDIEDREDGGTPAFLQTMKAALAMELKDVMGTKAMAAREKEQMAYLFGEFDKIEGMTILAGHLRERLGAISFFIEGQPYNFTVQLLNDLFGIQTRGGCSCAGTYGHYLLDMDMEASHLALSKVLHGDAGARPGWVRLSIHPTHTDAELKYIVEAIKYVAEQGNSLADEYEWDRSCNLFRHKKHHYHTASIVNQWFMI